MAAIQRLELQSDDPGWSSIFYAENMGLPITQEGAIQAGKTELRFVPAETSAVYHFAFNISSNKIDGAADWLEERGIPIRFADGRRIVEFQNWNAHAVYFQDTSGNILEFIARHDLPPGDDEPFSVKDILGISEIGVVVDDVLATVESIRAELGFEVYKDSLSADFAAVGDHEGLLIVVRKDRTWFGSPDLKAAPFPAKVKFETKDGYALMA